MKALSALIALIIIVSTVSGIALRASSAQHLLDLTKVGIVATTPQTNEAGGIGYSGMQSPEVPFRLELSRLDRQIYVLGSGIEYEVTLQNIGQTAFALPWSVDRAAVERGGPFLQASLALMVMDADRRENLIGAVILDGSDDVPGSLEVIEPGEIARIRTRERINVRAVAAQALVSVNPALVQAIFTMKMPPIGVTARVISDNSIPVSLRLASRP
jgi:hypothetical protein